MITLGGLQLPELTFANPWATNAVTAPVRRRLDGGLAVYPKTLIAGRGITLIAPADQPLTVDQADALVVMAASPGATYALSMPLRSFSVEVMFDWDGGDPLDLTQLFDYPDPDSDDPVTGTIKLMTV